jgi:hypothetical protein
VRIRLGDPRGAPYIEGRPVGPDELPDIGLRFSRAGGFPLFSLPLLPGEKLFGLGQHNERSLNLRGHRFRLFNRYRSHMLAVPVLLSSRGAAIVMDTTWPTEIDLSGGRLRWLSEEGALSFFLIQKNLRRNFCAPSPISRVTRRFRLAGRWDGSRAGGATRPRLRPAGSSARSSRRAFRATPSSWTSTGSAGTSGWAICGSTAPPGPIPKE